MKKDEIKDLDYKLEGAKGEFPRPSKVVAYITEKENQRYLYDKEELVKSIVDGTKLYSDYQEGNLIALKTNKGDYIDYRDVQEAMDNSSEDLDLDQYVGSAEAKRIYVRPEEVKKVKLD